MKTATFRQTIRQTEKNLMQTANGCKVQALKILTKAQSMCKPERELTILCIVKNRISAA